MILFKFTGADAEARLPVFLLIGAVIAFALIIVFSGLITFSLASAIGVLKFLLIVIGILFVGALGFRNRVVVTEQSALIEKKWFFIPYRRFTAALIEDVWFVGDWGLPDGAIGVVVEMAGKEIPIGSRKTMHGLYGALYPLSAAGMRSASQHDNLSTNSLA